MATDLLIINFFLLIVTSIYVSGKILQGLGKIIKSYAMGLIK